MLEICKHTKGFHDEALYLLVRALAQHRDEDVECLVEAGQQAETHVIDRLFLTQKGLLRNETQTDQRELVLRSLMKTLL